MYICCKYLLIQEKEHIGAFLYPNNYAKVFTILYYTSQSFKLQNTASPPDQHNQNQLHQQHQQQYQQQQQDEAEPIVHGKPEPDPEVAEAVFEVTEKNMQSSLLGSQTPIIVDVYSQYEQVLLPLPSLVDCLVQQ
jgi:hypothetical protein